MCHWAWSRTSQPHMYAMLPCIRGKYHKFHQPSTFHWVVPSLKMTSPWKILWPSRDLNLGPSTITADTLTTELMDWVEEVYDIFQSASTITFTFAGDSVQFAADESLTVIKPAYSSVEIMNSLFTPHMLIWVIGHGPGQVSQTCMHDKSAKHVCNTTLRKGEIS